MIGRNAAAFTTGFSAGVTKVAPQAERAALCAFAAPRASRAEFWHCTICDSQIVVSRC